MRARLILATVVSLAVVALGALYQNLHKPARAAHPETARLSEDHAPGVVDPNALDATPEETAPETVPDQG